MADPEFRGLNRLSALQSSRFGTGSALRPSAVSGVVGQQYRRQQEDYNTAMRLLRRQARRGDAGSALEAIKLREDANAKGFAPGGIRRREEFDAGIRGRAAALETATADAEKRAALDRAAADAMTPAKPKSPALAELDKMEESGDLRNARDLGVADPTSVVPRDMRLKYRKTLDAALGSATTPEEVASLKERGARFGVSGKAFDRRAEWWNRNR